MFFLILTIASNRKGQNFLDKILDKFIQRLKVVNTFNLSSNEIYLIKASVLMDKSHSIDTSYLFFCISQKSRYPVIY